MLAYEETGKYVSERHAEASAEGKLTSGKIAGMLSKKFGKKITAKEVKPFASEWHHSGFYQGNRGSTMGRTYFFAPNTDLEKLYKEVCEARANAAEIAAEPEVERYFFSAGFEKLHRQNRYQKAWRVFAIFEMIKCNSSNNAKKTEISREDYEVLKQFAGRDLEAYEFFEHFKARMEEI